MSDTTVLVKGEGWKFKAAIGLGGLAVIVILAFLYRVEVGIIVLVIGLGIGAWVWVWAIHQHKLAGFERRRLLAEVKMKEYEADRARILRHFLEFNSGVFHVDHPAERVEVKQFYPAVQASKWLADAPALLPETEPRLRRLLDVDFIHMLIRGPSGSGKTTIGNWLIDNARPGAAVYVLDPQATQNAQEGLPWSPRAEIVGDGRDWLAIDTKLVSLMDEMDRRYKPGVGPILQEIFIVSDEWLTVMRHCPHAGEFFETIGSEARKVKMRLVIMTISATVDDLKCPAPVRDNLVELRLDHGLKARNRGELRWGRGNVETVELPGPYRVAFAPARAVTEPMPIQEAVEPLPVLDAGPVSPVPTVKELRICELWDEGGRSQRAIYLEVYGKEPGGGRQLNEGVTEVLRRFGRIE